MTGDAPRPGERAGDGPGRVDRTESPDGAPSPDGEAPQGSTGDESRRVVDRADYDPEYDPSRPVVCEVCGAEMYYTGSCKLRCPRCGYTRDCSDP